jgi:hypothetical protein
MLPHRSVVAGRFGEVLVAIVFPLCVKEVTGVGEAPYSLQMEQEDRGWIQRSGRGHAAGATVKLASAMRHAGDSRRRPL